MALFRIGINFSIARTQIIALCVRAQILSLFEDYIIRYKVSTYTCRSNILPLAQIPEPVILPVGQLALLPRILSPIWVKAWFRTYRIHENI